MKNKKVYSITIAILFFGLVITAIPTMAGDFNSVYGKLYINDKIAPSGVEVRISFFLDGAPNGEEPSDHKEYTDENGTYAIDFQLRNYEEGYFKVKYKDKWYTPEGNPSVLITPGDDLEDIAYEQDLYIEVSEGGSGGGGGGGSGGGGSGGGGGGGAIIANDPPNADASASETTGIAGVPVNLDGSLSTDSDGDIDGYRWDFTSDGTYDTSWSSDATTTNVFASEGTYTVTLQVRDDGGATDTDQIEIIIAAAPNNPPTTPVISGPHMGTQDSSIDFTAVSTDLDDDDIQYNFTWGDDQSESTDFYASGTEAPADHSWSDAGIYTITVFAYDNESESGSANHIILIDAWWVKNIGYLLDEDADGVYDIFHSNETGEETDVEQSAEGSYLIDSDDTAGWDWSYDTETDTLDAYSEPDKAAEEDYTLWYILIVIIIVIIILLLLASRKKKKPEPKKPEPKKNKSKK